MSSKSIHKIQRVSLVMVSMILILLMVLYLIKHRERLILLMDTNKPVLVYLLLSAVMTSYTVAYTFKNLMMLFKLPLKVWEWIGLSVTNSMYNYFLPFQGAALIRAQYLKRKYSFEYSTYAALTSGALLIGLLTAGFTSCFLLLIKYFITGHLYKSIFIVVIFLFTFTLLLAIFLWFNNFRKISTKWVWLNRQLEIFFDGITFYKRNNSLLLRIVATNIALYLFMGLRLYFAFKVTGVQIDLVEIVVIQSVSVFSMILPITPGNLGIREGIIGLTSVMLNIPLEDAVLAASIDRVAGMVIIFFFGALFHIVLTCERKSYF